MGTVTKIIGKPSVITNEEDGKRSVIMRLADAIEVYRKPSGEQNAVSTLRKDKSLTMGFAALLHCIANCDPDVADMNLNPDEMSTILTGANIEVEIENHEAGEKWVDEDGVEHTYQYNCSNKNIKSIKFKAGAIDNLEQERKDRATFSNKAEAIFAAAKKQGFDKNVAFNL